MIKKSTATTALALTAAMLSGNASAEIFGLIHGRSANPGNLSQSSVEAGVMVGGDYNTYGARLNYKLSDVTTVYGDVGLHDVDNWNGDGFGFGGGLYYYLPDQRFLEGFDVAVHGSFHMTTLDSNYFGSNVDVDMNALVLDMLVSPQEAINENGMAWFASAGFTRVASDVNVSGFGGGSDSDIELSFSGGVTLPMGPGEVYGGIDYVDGLSFAAGFRYSL